MVIISFNLPGRKNMQLQPHDLHICPCSHHVSCAFQPNADQELDGFVDKIRCRGDKLSQAAGQRAQGCGRKMHTSGLIDRQKDFKFVCSWSIKSFFEHFAPHDFAGQATCIAHLRRGVRHRESKNAKFSLKILEQAAKDVGGQFTNTTKTDLTTKGESLNANKPTVIELVAPHVKGTD